MKKQTEKNQSRLLNEPVAPSAVMSLPTSKKSPFRLDEARLKKIYHWMLQARLLEERMIRMYKQSDGYFWIGAPGEEAFSVPLAMLAHQGQGTDYDFFHLHYRSLPILLVLGIDPRDAMRQMKNTASDPFSGGRNFSNHFSKKAWNVVPVSSTIETQYLSAIGSAIAQKKRGGTGITIVNGGDAGTAEGDFASCLVWASRPQAELPLLILVTHNQWGISTAASTQHGDQKIADRGKAFGIKTQTIQGNDVEESYFALKAAMEYVRTERKPFLLEASVSRLYGHSSATGCNFVSQEEDCLVVFEQRLLAGGVFSAAQIKELRAELTEEYLKISQQVKLEPLPEASTMYDHVYYGQKGRYW